MRPKVHERTMAIHRLGNGFQTLLLLGGIGLLAMLTGAAFGGADGMVLAGLSAGALMFFSRGIPPKLVMRFHGGRPVSPQGLPELFRMISALSYNAGLERAPDLYLIPSRSANAFTAGQEANAAIAVTEGLVRALDSRELYGVLAHEVGHIRNGDTGVMTLSDVFSRVTHFMSFAGKLLFILNLPLVLLTEARFSWSAILILVFSPTLVDLLRLALSRNREFDADLEAVRLSGDPAGLASGLQKIDRQTRLIERMFIPAGVRIPSFLRTHPATQERVVRLMSLGAHRGEPYGRCPDGDASFLCRG